MSFMFAGSKFNQDISRWDVSHVKNMEYLFYSAEFNQDITDWKPRVLENRFEMFKFSLLEKYGKLPYWVDVSMWFMDQAINAHELQKNLSKNLNLEHISRKDSTIKSIIKI